jgi:hypothetical protein
LALQAARASRAAPRGATRYAGPCRCELATARACHQSHACALSYGVFVA